MDLEEKEMCFLCTKEITVDGKQIESSNYDHEVSTFLLYQIVQLHHLKKDIENLKENFRYCRTCKKRIMKIQNLLEELERLEKEIKDDKYQIELILKENSKDIQNNNEAQNQNSIKVLRNAIAKELRSRTTETMLKKICKKRVASLKLKSVTDRKVMKKKCRRANADRRVPVQIESGTDTVVPKNIYQAENTTPTTQNKLDHGRNDNEVYMDVQILEVEVPKKTVEVIDLDLESEPEVPVQNETPVVYKDDRFPDAVSPAAEIEPEPDLPKEFNFDKCFPCGMCNSTFEDFIQLGYHLEQIHAPRHVLRTCSKCPKEFPTFELLKVHLKTHRRSRKSNAVFKCQYCTETFTEKKVAFLHQIRHNNSKINCLCPHCEIPIQGLKKLKVHLKNFHKGLEGFKCQFCHKSFHYEDRCKSHEATHSPDVDIQVVKLYECYICKKTFKQECDRQEHYRCHPRSYQCVTCGGQYRSAARFRKHSCSGKRTKRLECLHQNCSRIFKTLKSFLIHEHQQKLGTAFVGSEEKESKQQPNLVFNPASLKSESNQNQSELDVEKTNTFIQLD